MTKTNSSNDELKDKQIIGNIGMYYVCYQLSLRGWNAMPTARNAKGIDIVAYSEDGKYIGIQVKTISKLTNVSLGACSGEFLFDFLIIVVRPQKASKSSIPVVYILSKDDVKTIQKLYGKKKNIFVRQDLYKKDELCYKNNWNKLDI